MCTLSQTTNNNAPPKEMRPNILRVAVVRDASPRQCSMMPALHLTTQKVIHTSTYTII